MAKRLLRAREAAEYCGLHRTTLCRYAQAGVVPVVWTLTKRSERRFRVEDLDALMGRDVGGIEAHYVRVSGSTGQEKSLEWQTEFLAGRATGTVFRVYSDRASGLNENRRGLRRLLDDAKAGKFTVVRVVYPDRLTRFGIEYLRLLLEAYRVRLVVEEHDVLPPQQELMQDLMSLIASFSGRYYKLRAVDAKRKLLQELADTVA